MRLVAALLATAMFMPLEAQARDPVMASEPTDVSVTVYRDPDRGVDDSMDRDWPQGFAMISETRTVTLPPGESTILFEGVSEGMVAVSAIVTGLPGGTIEKNRNADLLSPAALVNGLLGNRVRITRSNPASGEAKTEEAILRTRADGGIVLQTSAGYEAVRCSGLPEKLTFDRVPTGLSADPVFSIDTRDRTGGTYTVTLTYLSWGFDWEANYVARLGEGGAKGKVFFDLMSWLTILNDNFQGFENAELLAVAGTLNIESDFESLAEAPEGNPVRLSCYPVGSTATGIPERDLLPPSAPPPPPPPMAMASEDRIVVTGARMANVMESAAPLAVIASEEQLGDLKLYRIPERIDVRAQGLKQVAFLDKKGVEGEFVYNASCNPYEWSDGDWSDRLQGTMLNLETVNEEGKGLGVALPSGGVTVFEPSSAGPLLIAERRIYDYAVTQDVEIEIADSSMVRSLCQLENEVSEDRLEDGEWAQMRAVLRNANSRTARVRLSLASPRDWDIRARGNPDELHKGMRVAYIDVPAGQTREFRWKIRRLDREED